MFKNHVSLSTCYGAMHVASLGPLGTHQAIAVAWGVNSGQLGIFFKVSRIQNLMLGPCVATHQASNSWVGMCRVHTSI